jgi:hypothetical protein
MKQPTHTVRARLSIRSARSPLEAIAVVARRSVPFCTSV